MVAQLSPNITDSYSPLNELTVKALRRFGDYFPDGSDADVAIMFIEFANMIIEEFNMHPYRTDAEVVDASGNTQFVSHTPIVYYTTVEEAREIPDMVMLNGLIFHYAAQQMDAKASQYSQLYYKTLNGLLYNRHLANVAAISGGAINSRPMMGPTR